MTYKFTPDEYDDIIYELNEKYDTLFMGLKEYTIESDEDYESAVYGMKVTIPSVGISVREGVVYSRPDGEPVEDILVIYDDEITNPLKFQAIHYNTTFEFIVSSYALRKGLSREEMENLECFMNEDEFEFLD